MTSSLPQAAALVFLFSGLLTAAAQQPPTTGSQLAVEDPSTETPTASPPAGLPAEATPGLPAASDAGPPELPEGFQEEFDRRLEVFRGLRDELREAIFRQRDIYIRYTNREVRSPAVLQTFYDQRGKVRKLLDQTYEAALDTMRMGVEEETATFVITMVEHRFKLDIYDRPTLEGAARLIDGGSTLTYLFQAGARSAVVSGEFDMAKRLLEAIDDDQMEEIDETLEYWLDDYEQAYQVEQAIREKEAQEDRLPRVAIRTTQGDVVVELFLDQAPSAVANFIQLVEQGFYDDLDFYQVIDHMLAMTGDSAGDGSGNSGRFLIDEHQRADARKAFRGSLVMAKLPKGDTGEFIPNSSSSQFAILFLPMLSITEHQTVFGRVIEGMDAISRLRRVDPSKKKSQSHVELPPDRIIEATVIRRPETLPKPQYWDPTRP